MEAFTLLPDPQTNGGLLISVRSEAIARIETLLIDNNLKEFITPVGVLKKQEEKIVFVK